MTYNEIMQKAGKRIKPNLYYYNNDTKIEISRNDIIKIRPHYSAGLIGTIMRGLEIELKISIPTSTIYFKNMAMFEENLQTKDYGEYYLKEKGTYNADTKTYTYQFYDGFLKLMVPYKAITIDYPCTVNDFIKKLANEMGLKCNVDLTNGSNYLGADIYENIGMTYRDVVADIGQGTFTLFEIVNNELKVCNFKENEIIINDDILKNKNITFNKKNGAFNTIIISRSAESDSLSKSNPENLPDNEKIAYRISDCQLLNRNDRGDYLDGLLNKIYGIEYYVYNVELTGYGGFDPLQKIKFETSSETFNSYVLNNEEIITQGYEENISASEIENVEQNYKVTDTDDRRINNVSLIVDKQQKEIKALAEKVVDISNTASGVGFVNITNGYKGNLHKLDIYGYMELPIIGNIIIGQFKVNNFKIIVEQNNEVYREYILDDMKNLYQVGTVHDTFEYLDGKCSITKRIGIDDEGNKYVLETPYTIDLKDFIIEVPEGDYKIYTNYEALHLNVEYLTQNEYTDTFATQVDVQSSIKIATDEILIESKREILDNGDALIASINTKSTGEVLINASKAINFNSTEFNVTTEKMKITIGEGENKKDIINANGVLTNLQFKSSNEVWGIGQSSNYFLGFSPYINDNDGSIPSKKSYLQIDYDVPNNFVVSEAYVTIFHTPVNWENSSTQQVWGYCRNLGVYNVLNSGNFQINAAFFSEGQAIGEFNSTAITNAFGNATYWTARKPSDSSHQSESKTTKDISSSLNSSGHGTLLVQSNDTPPYSSTIDGLYTENGAGGKTGSAYAILNIIGYTKV